MNEIKVKKVCDSVSISEWGLSKRLYNLVKDYEPKELIHLVRNKNYVFGIGNAFFTTLRGIKGVGEKLFAELEEAVDRAGYIRHDFDQRSLGIESLCSACGIDFTIGGVAAWTPLRNGNGPISADVYETYQNLSEQQIEDVAALIDELGPKMAPSLKYRFHLADKAPKGLTDEDVLHRCRSAIENIRRPGQNFCTRLKYIVCIGTEEECNKTLHKIMGGLAEIYEQPLMKKWRELNANLSTTAQSTPFESAQRLEEFMKKNFDLPAKSIVIDNSDFVNFKCMGLNTVGDFVMYCYAHPKDWFGKVGHSKSLEDIRTMIDDVEELGALLPLTDKLRDEKLSVRLEKSGLSAKAIEAIDNLYYYDYRKKCIGDVIMDLYHKPEQWFRYNYEREPDMGFDETLEILNMITNLGFEIPPSDGIIVPEEKSETLPSFEQMNLSSMTLLRLRESGISNTEQLLETYNKYPGDWYKRLRLKEGAVEVLLKMAAMGYLDVFLPDIPNKDTPGHRKHSMGEYQELFNVAN